jgi:hypothetical protein
MSSKLSLALVLLEKKEHKEVSITYVKAPMSAEYGSVWMETQSRRKRWLSWQKLLVSFDIVKDAARSGD